MDLEYYVSQFSSNDPGEDRFSARYHPNYGSFFCVIDGHGGCFSCDLANTYILDYFIEEISKLSKPYSPSLIIQVLNSTFKRCDDLILQEAVRIQNLHLESRCPGRTGCCVAVVAVIEEKLYAAHVGDCRVVICRSLERSISPMFPEPPPLVECLTSEESLPSSPHKRLSKEIRECSSPSKRTRNQSVSVPPHHSRKKVFLNRDFHLEAVLAKSNSHPSTLSESESGPRPSPTGSGGSERSESRTQNNETTPPQEVKTDLNKEEPNGQENKIKKKKKHNKIRFTEEDFDFSEFSGTFPNLQVSLHCITKDHCCDDKEERTALKLLCPTDPKPMRSSSNDKKLFGKDAIKRVGGSLAVTRALGDGYLKVPYLSEEPLKSHVPYITGFPYVSCRKITFGIDAMVLIASDGLWNYITVDEVAYLFHEYLATRQSSLFLSHPSKSISELLLERCLHNAAILAGTSLESLLTMPSGSSKRNVVDDVTIVVIIIPPSLPHVTSE